MKLELSTGIYCPNCKKEMTIETGLLGGLFFGSLITSLEKRIKREGATITCPHCKKSSYIEP